MIAGVEDFLHHFRGMATSRVFFARAYAEGRWHAEEWEGPVETREQWVAALDGSAERVRHLLAGTRTSGCSAR